jgi:hypothetical protein
MVPAPTLFSVFEDLQPSFFGERRPPREVEPEEATPPGQQARQQTQRQPCFRGAELWNELYFPLQDKQPRPNKAVDTKRIPAAEFALHETTTLTRMTYRASDIR